MINNYTITAKQRCLDLIDSDIDSIWDGIQQMPTDTTADKWKNKFRSMANEYTFSSRFALMRIFLGRADTSQLIDSKDPLRGFSVYLTDGTVCMVEDITMNHAENLSEEEVLQFEKLLLDNASHQSNANPIADALIIRKALVPVERRTTLLTREEAFHLGHLLQFTLQEMEWFLLRVFDFEDGFCYNTSNDLIEAYGFLTGNDWQTVDAIKQQYEAIYGKDDDGNYRVTKRDFETKENDWTKDVGGTLPEMVKHWTTYHADAKEKLFLEWLGERAPYLDSPSKTALRIYRNLAVYAYNLALMTEDTPDVDIKKHRHDGKFETDFLRCIREIVQKRDYEDQTIDALFEDGRISQKRCKSVESTLLLENQHLAAGDQSDKAKVWHIIQVLTDGKMTINGGVNASRTRVRDILSGKITRIEKSDMQYLLWFISNLCWFDTGDSIAPEIISNRLSDFIDASELCLNAAWLPAFYPPHLMEQSMMLSIVCAFSGEEICDPAETYEFICSSIIKRRQGHAN